MKRNLTRPEISNDDYRTRFNLVDLVQCTAMARCKGSAFSIGPALQYYHFDKDDNQGRFINNTEKLLTYDSANLSSDKMHLGLIASTYTLDQRNDKILPCGVAM